METQLDACIQLAEKILKRITGSSAAPPLHQELTPLSVISLRADGRFIAADDVETCKDVESAMRKYSRSKKLRIN